MIYRTRIGKHSWRAGPLGRLHLWALKRWKTPPPEPTSMMTPSGSVQGERHFHWLWVCSTGRPRICSRVTYLINVPRNKLSEEWEFSPAEARPYDDLLKWCRRHLRERGIHRISPVIPPYEWVFGNLERDMLDQAILDQREKNGEPAETRQERTDGVFILRIPVKWVNEPSVRRLEGRLESR